MTDDQKAALLAIRKESQAKEVETPVEAVEGSAPATEEVSKTESQELPKEQTQEETITEVVETPTSWDDVVEEKKAEPQKFDFTKLGSALGEDIKSEEEFVAKTTELKSKLKALEENPLEGIPEEFKEVIKVAKTGDWKEYLANQMTDFTKYDPVVEFEQDFLNRAQRNPKYFTDGKFDLQKAEDALDTVPEAMQESQGIQILEAKMRIQAQHKSQMEAQANLKRETAAKTLTQATKNIQELLPFESYGIKFEPKHSQEIYDGINNSKLTKKHLGINYDDLVRSNADMKAIARTIAAAEYAEKMVKFKADASKTEGKKEILSKIQNAQLKTTGSIVNPSDTETKIVSADQKLKAHKEAVRRGL